MPGPLLRSAYNLPFKTSPESPSENKKPAGKNGRVIQLRQLFFVNRYFIFKEIPDRPKMILRIGVTISLLSKLVKRNLN